MTDEELEQSILYRDWWKQIEPYTGMMLQRWIAKDEASFNEDGLTAGSGYYCTAQGWEHIIYLDITYKEQNNEAV